jgi:gas vesicle protein
MKTVSKIMIAIGAGLAIGSVLGVLFAPDKGSETRRKLREGRERWVKRTEGKLKWGKEKLNEKGRRGTGRCNLKPGFLPLVNVGRAQQN